MLGVCVIETASWGAVGRALGPQSRQPGIELGAGASNLGLVCYFSSPIGVNDYLAIDSNGYLCRNRLHNSMAELSERSLDDVLTRFRFVLHFV